MKPKRSFPQMNKDKAGQKGGSGSAAVAKQIIPTEGIDDGWNVDGTKNRNEDAVSVNGEYKGVVRTGTVSCSAPAEDRVAPRKGDAYPGKGW